jgi:hypothetical protein
MNYRGAKRLGQNPRWAAKQNFVGVSRDSFEIGPRPSVRVDGMADRDAKKGPPSPSLLNFCAKFQKIEIREMCDPKSKCPVSALIGT